MLEGTCIQHLYSNGKQLLKQSCSISVNAVKLQMSFCVSHRRRMKCRISAMMKHPNLTVYAHVFQVCMYYVKNFSCFKYVHTCTYMAYHTSSSLLTAIMYIHVLCALCLYTASRTGQRSLLLCLWQL